MPRSQESFRQSRKTGSRSGDPCLNSELRRKLAMRRLRRSAQEHSAASFDDLVGAGEQRGWDREAKRGRGFEVHEKLEDGWLVDRQISRLRPLQQLVYVSGGAV